MLGTMLAEKTALRTTLLSARRATPATARSFAAERILAAVAELLMTVRPGTVAGYVPVGSEPGGPELPNALGPRVLLPVLLDDLDLDWAGGALVPGPRGLLEPSGPRLGVDAIATADLVIVPALAVDHSGARLGKGGGSYDRALARVRPGVPVVAVVFDGEFLPRVPAEPHDRPVTGVITPSGGFECLPRHVD
ncbi:5-formyltetrahydrofolate cyclo-ligase [Longispora fulva]|uniref:5-formyltetrahydrofolate cyclo-ligase n=1 Tax=Longispora fulva TaxID=619741 RepID=UPI0018CAB4DB|nr:5-formyltetrahydrofolate cyclo-ligase [Longispora fulva]